MGVVRWNGMGVVYGVNSGVVCCSNSECVHMCVVEYRDVIKVDYVIKYVTSKHPRLLFTSKI